MAKFLSRDRVSFPGGLSLGSVISFPEYLADIHQDRFPGEIDSSKQCWAFSSDLRAGRASDITSPQPLLYGGRGGT